MNEVLAKVKRESIVAIVVARKDDESLKIAGQRQQDVAKKLGVHVPIVFYDSRAGEMTLIKGAPVQNSAKALSNQL